MFVTITLNPAVDCTLQVQPVLTTGRVHQVCEETITPGGKGVNVAKMLALNGMAVTAGGLIGAADRARYEKFLGAAGVKPNFLELDDCDTRRNLMVVDGAGGEMKFNRPGFPALEYCSERLGAYCLSLLSEGEVFILSGSVPSRFPSEAWAQVGAELLKHHKRVVLDTSGASLQAAAKLPVEVIKPNRRELEALSGRCLDSEQALLAAIEAQRERHAVVLVSDGKAGLYAADAAHIYHVSAPQVNAVDTTGAGDALLGQFCADYFGRNSGLSQSCLRRATAAGAAACEQPGTPMLSLERIEALMPHARVAVLRRIERDSGCWGQISWR